MRPQLLQATNRLGEAVLDGKRVACQRDLAAERAALSQLLSAAPVLEAAVSGNQLTLADLTECLSLLRALEDLADQIRVEWPQADPIRLAGTADLSSLTLDLAERQDWLEANGTLRVDEERVLDLMGALARRTRDGGYLQLGPDQYLALSAELQTQLRALEAAASTAPGMEPGDGGRLRMAPITLGAARCDREDLRSGTTCALNMPAR